MLKNLLLEAVLEFFVGHFTGIAKALTIHREHAAVTIRDVFGAALRIMALCLPFATFPAWLRGAVISLLALSFLLRVIEVAVTLFLMRKPAPAAQAATQASPVELESEAMA